MDRVLFSNEMPPLQELATTQDMVNLGLDGVDEVEAPRESLV